MTPNTTSMLVRTIIAGPHADDVPIAVHKAKRLLPGPQLLLTIFSVSQHTGPTYTPHPDEDIVSTRELEDRRYAEMEGMSYLGLGFHDAPSSAEERDERRPWFVQAAQRRLLRLLSLLDPEFLLAPLPYPNRKWRHIHHWATFQAALEAVSKLTRPALILYDDVAYSRAPVDAVVRFRGVDYVPFLIPLSEEDVAHKMDAIGVYQSQTPARFADAVTQSAPGDHLVRPSEVLRIPRHIRIEGLEEYSSSREDSFIYDLPEPFPSATEAFEDPEERRTSVRGLEKVGAFQ